MAAWIDGPRRRRIGFADRWQCVKRQHSLQHRRGPERGNDRSSTSLREPATVGAARIGGLWRAPPHSPRLCLREPNKPYFSGGMRPCSGPAELAATVCLQAVVKKLDILLNKQANVLFLLPN